jgi:hypothetical protein
VEYEYTAQLIKSHYFIAPLWKKNSCDQIRTILSIIKWLIRAFFILLLFYINDGEPKGENHPR